jgi:diaminopimelate decarboxylase
MDHFQYQGDTLYAEGVPLDEIARESGTPCYVYSRATLERHWRAFDHAFAGRRHLVCYAVKANGNLGVLNVLARLESGFDIVSIGELERVLAAGGEASRVVFSGVGKRAEEMRRALALGIRCFNVESEAELERLNRVAGELGRVAPVSLRVNPDVDARTHPYIATGLKENKFGIDIAAARDVYRRAADMPHLEVVGVDCHIGSQLTDLDPFLEALDRILELNLALRGEGIFLQHLDVGGGLGVRYRDETPPEPAQYAAAIDDRLADCSLEVLIEPGRAIVANAGVLLTSVEYLKPTAHKDFAIVDAAMNDLLRPALYDAWHEVVPVKASARGRDGLYDLVGPVCESSDVLARGRSLSLASGDLLAIRTAGAYGFAMASNYNGRPRPAEVMVDGEHVHVVRRRETCHELFKGESVLP